MSQNDDVPPPLGAPSILGVCALPHTLSAVQNDRVRYDVKDTATAKKVVEWYYHRLLQKNREAEDDSEKWLEFLGMGVADSIFDTLGTNFTALMLDMRLVTSTLYVLIMTLSLVLHHRMVDGDDGENRLIMDASEGALVQTITNKSIKQESLRVLFSEQFDSLLRRLRDSEARTRAEHKAEEELLGALAEVDRALRGRSQESAALSSDAPRFRSTASSPPAPKVATAPGLLASAPMARVRDLARGLWARRTFHGDDFSASEREAVRAALDAFAQGGASVPPSSSERAAEVYAALLPLPSPRPSGDAGRVADHLQHLPDDVVDDVVGALAAMAFCVDMWHQEVGNDRDTPAVVARMRDSIHAYARSHFGVHFDAPGFVQRVERAHQALLAAGGPPQGGLASAPPEVQAAVRATIAPFARVGRLRYDELDGISGATLDALRRMAPADLEDRTVGSVRASGYDTANAFADAVDDVMDISALTSAERRDDGTVQGTMERAEALKVAQQDQDEADKQSWVDGVKDDLAEGADVVKNKAMRTAERASAEISKAVSDGVATGAAQLSQTVGNATQSLQDWWGNWGGKKEDTKSEGTTYRGAGRKALDAARMTESAETISQISEMAKSDIQRMRRKTLWREERVMICSGASSTPEGDNGRMQTIVEDKTRAASVGACCITIIETCQTLLGASVDAMADGDDAPAAGGKSTATGSTSAAPSMTTTGDVPLPRRRSPIAWKLLVSSHPPSGDMFAKVYLEEVGAIWRRHAGGAAEPAPADAVVAPDLARYLAARHADAPRLLEDGVEVHGGDALTSDDVSAPYAACTAHLPGGDGITMPRGMAVVASTAGASEGGRGDDAPWWSLENDAVTYHTLVNLASETFDNASSETVTYEYSSSYVDVNRIRHHILQQRRAPQLVARRPDDATADATDATAVAAAVTPQSALHRAAVEDARLPTDEYAFQSGFAVALFAIQAALYETFERSMAVVARHLPVDTLAGSCSTADVSEMLATHTQHAARAEPVIYVTRRSYADGEVSTAPLSRSTQVRALSAKTIREVVDGATRAHREAAAKGSATLTPMLLPHTARVARMPRDARLYDLLLSIYHPGGKLNALHHGSFSIQYASTQRALQVHLLDGDMTRWIYVGPVQPKGSLPVPHTPLSDGDDDTSTATTLHDGFAQALRQGWIEGGGAAKIAVHDELRLNIPQDSPIRPRRTPYMARGTIVRVEGGARGAYELVLDDDYVCVWRYHRDGPPPRSSGRRWALRGSPGSGVAVDFPALRQHLRNAMTVAPADDKEGAAATMRTQYIDVHSAQHLITLSEDEARDLWVGTHNVGDYVMLQPRVYAVADEAFPLNRQMPYEFATERLRHFVETRGWTDDDEANHPGIFAMSWYDDPAVFAHSMMNTDSVDPLMPYHVVYFNDPSAPNTRHFFVPAAGVPDAVVQGAQSIDVPEFARVRHDRALRILLWRTICAQRSSSGGVDMAAWCDDNHMQTWLRDTEWVKKLPEGIVKPLRRAVGEGPELSEVAEYQEAGYTADSWHMNAARRVTGAAISGAKGLIGTLGSTLVGFAKATTQVVTTGATAVIESTPIIENMAGQLRVIGKAAHSVFARRFGRVPRVQGVGGAYRCAPPSDHLSRAAPSTTRYRSTVSSSSASAADTADRAVTMYARLWKYQWLRTLGDYERSTLKRYVETTGEKYQSLRTYLTSGIFASEKEQIDWLLRNFQNYHKKHSQLSVEEWQTKKVEIWKRCIGALHEAGVTKDEYYTKWYVLYWATRPDSDVQGHMQQLFSSSEPTLPHTTTPIISVLQEMYPTFLKYYIQYHKKIFPNEQCDLQNIESRYAEVRELAERYPAEFGAISASVEETATIFSTIATHLASARRDTSTSAASSSADLRPPPAISDGDAMWHAYEQAWLIHWIHTLSTDEKAALDKKLDTTLKRFKPAFMRYDTIDKTTADNLLITFEQVTKSEEIDAFLKRRKLQEDLFGAAGIDKKDYFVKWAVMKWTESIPPEERQKLNTLLRLDGDDNLLIGHANLNARQKTQIESDHAFVKYYTMYLRMRDTTDMFMPQDIERRFNEARSLLVDDPDTGLFDRMVKQIRALIRLLWKVVSNGQGQLLELVTRRSKAPAALDTSGSTSMLPSARSAPTSTASASTSTASTSTATARSDAAGYFSVWISHWARTMNEEDKGKFDANVSKIDEFQKSYNKYKDTPKEEIDKLLEQIEEIVSEPNRIALWKHAIDILHQFGFEKKEYYTKWFVLNWWFNRLNDDQRRKQQLVYNLDDSRILRPDRPTRTLHIEYPMFFKYYEMCLRGNLGYTSKDIERRYDEAEEVIQSEEESVIVHRKSLQQTATRFLKNGTHASTSLQTQAAAAIMSPNSKAAARAAATQLSQLLQGGRTGSGSADAESGGGAPAARTLSFTDSHEERMQSAEAMMQLQESDDTRTAMQLQESDDTRTARTMVELGQQSEDQIRAIVQRLHDQAGNETTTDAERAAQQLLGVATWIEMAGVVDRDGSSDMYRSAVGPSNADAMTADDADAMMTTENGDKFSWEQLEAWMASLDDEGTSLGSPSAKTDADYTNINKQLLKLQDSLSSGQVARLTTQDVMAVGPPSPLGRPDLGGPKRSREDEDPIAKDGRYQQAVALLHLAEEYGTEQEWTAIIETLPDEWKSVVQQQIEDDVIKKIPKRVEPVETAGEDDSTSKRLPTAGEVIIMLRSKLSDSKLPPDLARWLKTVYAGLPPGEKEKWKVHIKQSTMNQRAMISYWKEKYETESTWDTLIAKSGVLGEEGMPEAVKAAMREQVDYARSVIDAMNVLNSKYAVLPEIITTWLEAEYANLKPDEKAQAIERRDGQGQRVRRKTARAMAAEKE